MTVQEELDKIVYNQVAAACKYSNDNGGEIGYVWKYGEFSAEENKARLTSLSAQFPPNRKLIASGRFVFEFLHRKWEMAFAEGHVVVLRFNPYRSPKYPGAKLCHSENLNKHGFCIQCRTVHWQVEPPRKQGKRDLEEMRRKWFLGAKAVPTKEDAIPRRKPSSWDFNMGDLPDTNEDKHTP